MVGGYTLHVRAPCSLNSVAYYLTHSVSILTDALEGIVNVVGGLYRTL